MLFQRLVEVGKDTASDSAPKTEVDPLEAEAEKNMNDVLSEDPHMKDETSQSGGSNLLNMAQMQEEGSGAVEEEAAIDDNEVQLIANEQGWGGRRRRRQRRRRRIFA